MFSLSSSKLVNCWESFKALTKPVTFCFIWLDLYLLGYSMKKHAWSAIAITVMAFLALGCTNSKDASNPTNVEPFPARTKSPPILESQPAQRADAEKMNRLMLERRDVLRKIVEVFMSRHQGGMVKFDDVYRAQSELLRAELELAKTKEDRLAVLNSQLANCQSLESLVIQMQKVGVRGGEAGNVLVATAARLQAEIQILRESGTENK